jgi:hypothetical protein
LLTKIKNQEEVDRKIGEKKIGGIVVRDGSGRGYSNLGIPRTLNILFGVVETELKRSVKQQSMAFLENDSAKINDVFLKQMLGTWKDKGIMPFYFAMKAIYAKALQEQIPIIFKVRNWEATQLETKPLNETNKKPVIKPIQPNSPSDPFVSKTLFKVINEGFIAETATSEDLGKPALIVEAYSKQSSLTLKRTLIVQQSLEKCGGLIPYLVEVDGAQHTQYPEKKGEVTVKKEGKDNFSEIPDLPFQEKELLLSKELWAQKNGFSYIDCLNFCVEHVYADLIGNQINGGKE